jgi:tRNA(Arg) A34 adenosine deaminase TadA
MDNTEQDNETVIATQADEKWMRQALELAKEAAAQRGVPGYCVSEGELVTGKGLINPFAYIIPRTCRSDRFARRSLDVEQLSSAAYYASHVTIEPCTMCVGARKRTNISPTTFLSRNP